jgi:hypothetical protein
MVNLVAQQVSIGGRFYNSTKSGYPSAPTIFSGVEISWGADSCIEHPDASRAELSLWVPKTHKAFLPSLGEVVKVNAYLTPPENASLYTNTARMFTGKVESIKLQDDHKATPAVAIPNSVNITATTGWTLRYSTTGASEAGRVAAAATVVDGDSFKYPFTSSGTHWFFTKTPRFNVTAGQNYTITWTDNNGTAYYTSEVRYYNSSGAQVGSMAQTISLMEGRLVFTPPVGAVTADVELITNMSSLSGLASVDGYYKIGKIVLGVPDSSGYRINITAADALAEASRLRLSDKPWLFTTVFGRQNRIATLASNAGVDFEEWPSDDQGAVEANDTWVRGRDVDSFPALEAYQRATMAAGHTVISADNKVQPSRKMNLPQVLGSSQPVSGAVYKASTGTGVPFHEMYVNGVLTRTNWASFATGRDVNGNYFTGGVYTAVPGTGGQAYIYSLGLDTPNVTTADFKNGADTIMVNWTSSATAGSQGVYYQQGANSISGASGSKVSAGVWVKSNVTRSVKLQVNLFNNTTAAGTLLSNVFNLVKDVWQWIKLDGVTATAAYNLVQVYIQPQTNMLAGQSFYIDGVLIEKTATSGTYFDSYTLDAGSNVVAIERSGVPAFDASAIVDDVFEIDTSKVVNDIKVEFKTAVGAYTATFEYVDNDQVFTDEEGSRKTTPQSRSIDTDWAMREVDMELGIPTSVMVTKGQLLLHGQSEPQWRMSNALSLVLSKVPAQEAIYSLLKEDTRFGSLLKITNGPELVFPYMRVRGGKIVLGEEPVLEFDLEPVEYSAPIPLSGATLAADYVASNYRIKNFKTLTAHDLRTIGVR